MELFVKGDSKTGYWVELGHGNDNPVLTGCSEFSAVFSDKSGEFRDSVTGWRARKFSRTAEWVELLGEIELPTLNAYVSVRVTYETVNDSVIKKEISFLSNNDLNYCLTVRLAADHEPKKYWTFEHEQHPGGPIYEIYPAVGMQIGELSYGFLTDNGYRNRWTRISRQTDGKGFLVALEKQPDAKLTSIASKEERARGIHYVQYRFGELIDYSDHEFDVMLLSANAGWEALASDAQVCVSESSIRVSGSGEGEKGIVLPVTLEKSERYEIFFEYNSTQPLSVRLLDPNRDTYFEWSKELGAYMDNIPATGVNEWKSFGKCLFSACFQNLHQETVLKIMLDPAIQEREYDFKVRNAQIRKYKGRVVPYHTLVAGKEQTTRVFAFEEHSQAHRDLQIASQVRLAEGLGFEGTEAESILYADNQMLVWIAQHDKLEPHVVPSLNYHPDMYLRDAFWEVNAVYDKEVAEQCWKRYAETQHPDGQLDTLARAYRYAPSVDDNDSTMFFIMWAYLNWKRYGTDIELVPLRKALANIRSLHCPSHNGRYVSRTAGWFDTIWGSSGVTAINQGHFAVVLQCAKALGLDVTDEEISLAKKAYRELYDPKSGFVHWSTDKDYLSPSVLMGEFMNLWLFDMPVLSDEAVIGTVERLPVVKRGVPCISDKNGRMFDDENKPWEQKYTWRQGVYHNGGSWFLYEYLAYSAAARHGWSKAKQRMDWRLEMEFSKEDEPYSHEFIPLTEDKDDWWPTCRLFGWNTFALIANQIAAGACERTLKNKTADRPKARVHKDL